MKNQEIKNIDSTPKIKKDKKENKIMTDKKLTTKTIIKCIIYTLTIFIVVLHWKYYKWLIKRLQKGFFAIQLPIIIDFLRKKTKK